MINQLLANKITILDKSTELLFCLLLLILIIIAFIIVTYFFMQHKKQQESIFNQDIDAMTGLMTFNKFLDEITKILSTAKPNEYYMAISDIDNFKIINKNYGFEIGNKLIHNIGTTLKSISRPDTMLCHPGADIYMIFGKSTDSLTVINPETKAVFFNKIATSVGITSTINSSTGIYVIEDTTETIDYILDCARTAKSHAKSIFGCTTCFFTEDMKKAQLKETEILTSMEKALESDDFYILIQPKIELASGKLIGGEALIRWQREDGYMYYPDEFIPLFESNKFITKLDYYVLDKVCQFIHNTKLELPCISVNISGATILTPNFTDIALNVLKKHNISPSKIELEITESVLDIDFIQLQKTALELRNAGFILSIDDFGKGASSLARIKSLDIDVIKLDKEFINNNFTTDKGLFILKSIISMGTGLNYSIIAEGIETQNQLDTLIELGCTHGQGYLFDRPLIIEEFLARVIKNSKMEFPELNKSSEHIKKYLSDFENLPFGFAVIKNDAEFTVINANSAFYKVIGYTRQEFKNNFHNQLNKILIDNVRLFIDNRLSKNLLTFDFEQRIKSFDNNILWVHDIAKYDPKYNVFYITLIRMPSNKFSTNENMSFETLILQRELSYYLNSSTSDFIFICDPKTDELLYINNNILKVYNFKDESEWKNKNYQSLLYGVSHSPYNLDNINEDYFIEFEHFNPLVNKYISIKTKIINLQGKKVRLHISSDISSDIKFKETLSLQSTINKCLDSLYNSSSLNTAFDAMLSHILYYYNSDSALYFEFVPENNALNLVYEVVSSGIKRHKNLLKGMSQSSIDAFISKFRQLGAFHFNINDVDTFKVPDEIRYFLNVCNASHVLLSPIQGIDANIIGFISVFNPKLNNHNLELINQLSRFIWLFVNNHLLLSQKKELEIEENSKIALLGSCSDLLQKINNDDDKSVNYILKLLRNHYGSDCGIVLSISDDRDTFSAVYEDCNDDTPSRLAYLQNKPIAMISKWIELFQSSNHKNYAVSTIDDLELSPQLKTLWNEQGLTSAYVVGLYDNNNEIKGLLSLDNPTITSRNLIILQVVAKFISDYMTKVSLLNDYKEGISIDSLTNLYNKLATQNKIIEHLNNSTQGTLFIIDIDNFKILNDTLGHFTGDKALIEVSAALKQISNKNDIVGRIGGDEFMIFSTAVVSEAIINKRASIICDIFRRRYESNNTSFLITASIGICRANDRISSFKSLYESADKALYQAKEKGRNTFCIYNNEESVE